MSNHGRDRNRAARLEQIRQEQAAATRRRRLAWVGGGTAAVLLAGGGITWALTRPAADVTTASAVPNTPASTATFTSLARDHVTTAPPATELPPAGGTHAAVWANCGIYGQPVRNENAVHSLEHGAFWITYRPDLPAEQVQAITSVVKGQPYALVSPYPNQGSPVVATAWGVQVALATGTDPALKDFVTRYADASKAPEPRGECTGGTGTPSRA